MFCIQKAVIVISSGLFLSWCCLSCHPGTATLIPLNRPGHFLPKSVHLFSDDVCNHAILLNSCTINPYLWKSGYAEIHLVNPTYCHALITFQLVKRQAGKRRTALTPTNFHSDRSYKYIPSRLGVFETGVMIPGCSEVSLALTMPCQLQLCTV